MTKKQWKVMNARRFELIVKDVDGLATDEERKELERLQEIAEEKIRPYLEQELKGLEELLKQLKGEN